MGGEKIDRAGYVEAQENRWRGAISRNMLDRGQDG